MKVLVTGADGFIGSHLVERLVDAGISVKALVYYNSFSSWGWLDTVDKSVMREVEVTVGDIRDASYVDRITADCTHILHLAALIGIPYSYQAAESYVQTKCPRHAKHFGGCKKTLGFSKLFALPPPKPMAQLNMSQ